MSTNLREALGTPDDELMPVRYPVERVVVHALDGVLHDGPRDRCKLRECIEAAVAAKEEQVGADCPKWLPGHPAVPWSMHTPCCLDAGHDGRCTPTDSDLYGRALLMVATGQLPPMSDADEEARRAAYRGLVDAHGMSGRADAFTAGFRAGWAHAHAVRARD